VDAAGNVWTASGAIPGGYPYDSSVNGYSLSGQPIPYRNATFSNPAGVVIALSAVPPSSTGTVTLKFLEPSKTATGQRRFSVSINGTQVVKDLDLFAVAGLLKPYDLTFPFSSSPLVIVLTPTTPADKAVLSGIQVDAVSQPPPGATSSGFQCPASLNDGVGNMFTGAYSQFACENLSDGPLRVTRARCRSDVDGQVLDILARDANGAWQSLLTAPFVCTAAGAEGALLPGASYPAGAVLLFAFRVVYATPATASQVLATVRIEP
jgi:hypothetical protein